jgi:TonB family protein
MAAALVSENHVYLMSSKSGASPPSVLSRVDPEYSKQADRANLSGTVLLSMVINTDGMAEDIRVVKSLGMGLDEKAIEALQKWRFSPAHM